MMVASDSSSDSIESKERIVNNRKIKIDGVDYEIPESAAQAFAKVEAELQAKLAESATALEQAKARADSADSDAKKAKDELAAAPAKIREQIASRVALETSARKIMGAEAKFDGLSDIELTKAAAEKHHGLKFEGKPEAYVQAMFDLAVAKAGEGSAVDAARSGTAPTTRSDATSEKALDEHKEKYFAAARDAWKNPVSK
jgi:hypothetical protein